MATRGRVAIIFGVMVGLAVLGLVFRRSVRAKRLRNAQAEVARWEARWYAARGCMLGKVPLSAKTREALAIHEMLPDPWEPAKCSKLVGALTRETGPDSGIDAIEAEWRRLDKVATAAAQAYVLHISPATKASDDPLPAALDALDEAHASLRRVAKLPPLSETGASLRAAQVVPIVFDGHAVTELEVDSVPSAHGLVLFGKSAQQDVQVILIAGGTPIAAAVGEGTLRSVPDASWGALVEARGALVEDQRVRVGDLDRNGLLRSDFDGKGVFDTHGRAFVAAALGTRMTGTLAMADGDKLVLVHLAGDAIEKAAPIPLRTTSDGPALVAAADVDGHAALVWSAPNGDVFARIIRPGDDGANLGVQYMPLGPFCLTVRAAWARVDGGAMTFGGKQFAVDSRSEIGTLLGCSETAALFRNEYDPHRAFVCGGANDVCTDTEVPAGSMQGPALALVGNEVVALASHGGVLGVWRGGAQPVFYSLPEPAMPVSVLDTTAMAMSDGAVIDVLARTPTKYVTVRVPVR